MEKKFDEMSRLEVIAELLKDGNQLAKIPHEKQEVWMVAAALGGNGDIYGLSADHCMTERIRYAMGLFAEQIRYTITGEKDGHPYPEVWKLSRLKPVRNEEIGKHPRKYKRQKEVNAAIEAWIGGMAIDCMKLGLITYSEMSMEVKDMSGVAKAAYLINPKNAENLPGDGHGGKTALYYDLKNNEDIYAGYTIDQILAEYKETFNAEKDKPLIPTKPHTR